VPNTPPFLADFKMAVFSPRRFLSERFLTCDSTRLTRMAQLATVGGLVIGGLITFGLTYWLKSQFTHGDPQALAAIQTLGMDQDAFLQMLKLQKIYPLLLVALSPLLAFMAPHIFGGLLFFFLGFKNRKMAAGPTFYGFLDCANFALISMIFYAVPLVGPPLGLILLAINISRALSQKFQLQGFIKGLGIFSAIYICFFVTSATLQLVALQLIALGD
jgi:hypothetical protein